MDWRNEAYFDTQQSISFVANPPYILVHGNNIITILNITAPGIVRIHKRGRRAASGAASGSPNIVTSVGLTSVMDFSDGDGDGGSIW